MFAVIQKYVFSMLFLCDTCCILTALLCLSPNFGYESAFLIGGAAVHLHFLVEVLLTFEGSVPMGGNGGGGGRGGSICTWRWQQMAGGTGWFCYRRS